jgi:hypothetical protein
MQLKRFGIKKVKQSDSFFIKEVSNIKEVGDVPLEHRAG